MNDLEEPIESYRGFLRCIHMILALEYFEETQAFPFSILVADNIHERDVFRKGEVRFFMLIEKLNFKILYLL